MAKTETYLPKPGRKVRDRESLVRLLLYAPRGFGKSYFADDFPDALVLNTDGNLPYYTSPGLILNNWEVVNPKTDDEKEMAKRSVVNVIDEIVRTGGNGFKTIIVDLAEGIYELCRTAKLAEYGMKHESDAGGFGKGYQLIDENRKKIINEKFIGTKPSTLILDSIFFPIKKVNYKIKLIHDTKGNIKESLNLEILTNGSITPKRSIQEALKILMNLFCPLFINQNFLVASSELSKKFFN